MDNQLVDNETIEQNITPHTVSVDYITRGDVYKLMKLLRDLYEKELAERDRQIERLSRMIDILEGKA